MSALDWKSFEWIELPFEDFDTVENDGIRHYNVGGNLLPSMTTMLKVLDDGGVDSWRKRVGEEEADKVVREAVARGNNLHELSELYLQNNLQRSEVKGPATLLFNRTRPHLNTLGPIIGIEKALYSNRLKYAGRVDCIAFQGKDLCIVDHKNTRNKVDLTKKYARRKLFKYMVQCAGYAVALHEMFPHLPMPSHGLLIFGNYQTMDSTTFKFPIQPMIEELELVVESYYNGVKPKQSAYFKL